MRGVKGFFAVYVIVYLAVAVAINALLGPPGMSEDYLAEYKADHDRYIEIGKDPAYRRWSQRPHLVERDDALAEAVAFVDLYENRPEFQAEQARRGRYDVLFDVFNAFMVVVLMIRFGRKPLVGVLDKVREQVRTRLDRAEANSREASELKKSAQDKMHALPHDKADIETQTEARIEEMRRETALRDGQSLAALNKETEDRKRNERERAVQALKEALVDTAVADVRGRFQDSGGSELQTTLVDRFIDDLAERKAADS